MRYSFKTYGTCSRQIDFDINDINVFCYGLKTNYTTQLFEGSKRLCELADL